MRYSSVDKHLARAEGILGVERDYGTKAKDILAATMNIIKGFAVNRQRLTDRPLHSGRAASSLRADLFEHLKNRIELFDADGATDEQRAGRLLGEVLPNLKLVIRDRTHAATRPVTVRPPPWVLVTSLRRLTHPSEGSHGHRGRLTST